MADMEMLRVLDAREQRWNKRIEMAGQYGRTIVTITLCLPLSCRTSSEYTTLFPRLCAQVQQHLTQGGICGTEPVYIDGADGPACFMAMSGTPEAVKECCVQTEERFAGGRMLDVDVMDSHGTPIGRSELGLPPRRCFICDQPAAVCVSGRVHQPEDVIRCAGELLAQVKRQYGDTV